MTFTMRTPCARCGEATGAAEERSGQDVVRCANGHYCYCRPKAESGKAQRTVRTRPAIKPSVRYRVLERDRHRCLSCGKAAPDVVLDVDHFLPLGHPLADGLGESELSELSEEANLVTLCEACNIGKSDTLPALPSVFSTLLRYYRTAGGTNA